MMKLEVKVTNSNLLSVDQWRNSYIGLLIIKYFWKVLLFYRISKQDRWIEEELF